MAKNGVGFSETIVHANNSPQAAYGYRSGMGMIPSAEFFVFMEDFQYIITGNQPRGWNTAIIDAGVTVVSSINSLAGPGSCCGIISANASEGATVPLNRCLVINPGKKMFVEARVYLDDVTDHAFQIGLNDASAITNPEDSWTTASNNVIAFGILDGTATSQLLVDAGNSGTTVQAGTRAMTVGWNTIAFEYDGVNVKGYVNGKLSQTWSGAASTIPVNVALAPFFGSLNGNGAGGATVLVDYFRIVAER